MRLHCALVSLFLFALLLLAPALAVDVGGAPSPSADVAISVEYTAPGVGFLSLGLCNERVQLVRSLLSAQPVKPMGAKRASITAGIRNRFIAETPIESRCKMVFGQTTTGGR